MRQVIALLLVALAVSCQDNAVPVNDAAAPVTTDDANRIAVEEPVTTDVNAQPVDNVAVVQPVNTDVNAQPVDNVAVVQPVDNVAVVQPVDNVAVVQPVTTDANAQPANNNQSAQNVVRLDNNFLLQLIAVKAVADVNNQDKALKELFALQTLFGHAKLAEANIGLSYNEEDASFELVDAGNNSALDTQALISRLQEQTAQNTDANDSAQNADANVPVSGLVGRVVIFANETVDDLQEELGHLVN